MIDVGKMIAAIRKDRGYSQYQLAQKLNMSKQSISNYERGAREPDYMTLEAIADVLNVPMSMLISREDQEKALSEIYDSYDKKPFISGELRNIEIKRIPILGDTAAGMPIIANRKYDEYINVPVDRHKFNAAVRVTGDSMEPNYHIGDLALIHYQEDVEDGQIAVVCLDDEVTLKRVYHNQNGLMLISDNPKYAPMPVTSDEVNNIHLTGRAVGVIHWEE